MRYRGIWVGTQTKRLKRRRRELFEADPTCHWCGIVTVWRDNPALPPPDDTATLDHLYCRSHPLRRVPHDGSYPRYVLACYKCNNERSADEDIHARRISANLSTDLTT